MHYLGMSAIRGPLTMTYDLWRVAVSVVVVAAAATALHVRRRRRPRHGARRFAYAAQSWARFTGSRSERSSGSSRSTWRTRTTQRSWPPITRAGFASPG
jgi:hypothetical protein